MTANIFLKSVLTSNLFASRTTAGPDFANRLRALAGTITLDQNQRQHHPVEDRTLILQRLSETNQSLVDRYLASARETLARFVSAPGLLENIQLERAPTGYARNLIFGDDQMSAWALVWSPGARTSIHDHRCSCCFAILSGTLREVRFSAVDDDCATKTAEHIRTPGFIASMMPSGPNIHQMINDGPGDAISIHIYGYDHRMFSSSVHREYRQIDN